MSVTVSILSLYRLILFCFRYKKTFKWNAIGNIIYTPLGSIPILCQQEEKVPLGHYFKSHVMEYPNCLSCPSTIYTTFPFKLNCCKINIVYLPLLPFKCPIYIYL